MARWRHGVPVADRGPGHSYTTHGGSAVFALPPGARPGGLLGEGLFSGATAVPSA